jgi:hypothetical protein
MTMFSNLCVICSDEIDPPARAQLGYRTCLWCGEDMAKAERTSWCVVQEYQKGGYMFVTADAARTTLKQTNQKGVRT